MPPVGFEPAISAGERPQTCALVRAATETGHSVLRPCIAQTIVHLLLETKII